MDFSLNISLTIVRIGYFFLLLWENNVINNKFKEILKLLRIENNVTQPQLATAIGVSNGLISLWENGLREPTMSNLIVLAKFFHVSIDYLVGLED